jgi:dUTP pyrophosphatase
MSLPVLNICRFASGPPKTEELLSVYGDRISAHNASALTRFPDSGFDIVTQIENQLVIPARSFSNKVPLGIKCAMLCGQQRRGLGFYLYPRSSTGSKSALRLSNSVGIIDSGYRGELIALFDNPSDRDEIVIPGQRLVQVCAGDLSPFLVRITDTLPDAPRGEGGLGSTGV